MKSRTPLGRILPHHGPFQRPSQPLGCAPVAVAIVVGCAIGLLLHYLKL